MIDPGVHAIMLQVISESPLDALETALRRAALQHQGSILAVSRVGHILPEEGKAAISFTVCHPDLYGALLSADIRMAAFLPCRIAAYSRGAEVVLETIRPLEFCRLLDRMDLAPLADPLEALLHRVMEDAARSGAAAAQASAGAWKGGLGATEEQVNLRASLPQRIDCKGTKVEDLGGTGEHDSQGG